MGAPRTRWMAFRPKNGTYIEFRARHDEIEEQLNDAISRSWQKLEPGEKLIVIRYTSLQRYTVADVEPAGWHHKMRVESKERKGA